MDPESRVPKDSTRIVITNNQVNFQNIQLILWILWILVKSLRIRVGSNWIHFKSWLMNPTSLTHKSNPIQKILFNWIRNRIQQPYIFSPFWKIKLTFLWQKENFCIDKSEKKTFLRFKKKLFYYFLLNFIHLLDFTTEWSDLRKIQLPL